MSNSTAPVELVQACSSGDVQLLYDLLSQQPDVAGLVNLTSPGGVSLLMHTIIGAGTSEVPTGQYTECCSLLIQGGAELEISDTTYGRTAAHWAVYYHRDDILTILIEAGSDMTCPDFTGTSPFHLGIQESAISCLLVALERLPSEILQISHPQFLLPLLHAVQCESLEACQLLVRAGADVNQVDEKSGRSALHFATEMNNRSLVDFFIGCGGVIDLADGRGLTPLHIACIVEGSDALEAIVKRVGGGEVLDIQDGQGLTPLMHSCLYGNLDSVRVLLKKKANVLGQDSEGKTCLHYAAESSSQTAHDCVQLVIKKEKQLLEMKDEYGRTPLHMCAASGTVATLDLLILSGSSVQEQDSSQRGLVHWAAVSGNHTVLSKLIEMECELDTPDPQGSTPLHYACKQSAEPDEEVYTEEASVRSQLVQQCVDLLLKGGASVDKNDAIGLTPLHYAVQFPNNLQVIHLLLSHEGVDPNEPTAVEGMTSLHLAARGGVVDACHYLLESTGGQVGTLVDKEGHTALHYAAGSGSPECVRVLLQAGLSANQTDNAQRSPTHVAASAGSAHCLQLLNDYGANLGMSSADGTTPLHEAAISGYPDIVEYLLSYDTSSINKGSGDHKATPLHHAVQGRHAECAQILLNYGAKVNAITLSEEGESLSALDLCDNDATIHELLLQFGALPGTEAAKEQEEEEEEQAIHKEEAELVMADEMVEEKAETLSIPGIRPTTPSRRSFVKDPVFEDDRDEYTSSPQHLSRVPTPATPPPPHPDAKRGGMGILKKALTMLKKKPSQQDRDSILSSAIGFYAAQGTMLAAAVIGTPLGEKLGEVAEKVATDTAEGLRKEAAKHEGEFPELVWLHEDVDDGPPPTPTPPPPTPPPPTPPPPIPKVQEDPYERRMRKARAQLDMSKSKGYLAVEELVKAQDTHMKLKRQFQEEKLQENIMKMRENFHEEERKAELASKKVMERFEGKMNKAEAESEEMNRMIERQLSEAREENEKLNVMMGEMGVNPRPTVAQWLQRKQMQKKTALQDTMIHWDRARRHREAALLVEHEALSHRAMKHAAWEAKKELGSKIKAVKKSPYLANSISSKKTSLPPMARGRSPMAKRRSPGKGHGGHRSPEVKHSPTKGQKSISSPHRPTPSPVRSEVLPTPTGFMKIPTHETDSRLTTPTARRITSSSKAEPLLWKIGEDYVVENKVPRLPHYSRAAFLRATGPRDVHAEKSLHFMLPRDYKAMKERDKTNRMKMEKQYRLSSPTKAAEGRRSPRKSTIVIRSLNFEQTKPIGFQKDVSSLSRTSPSGAKYHSHADNIDGSGLYPRLHSSEVPSVLAMKVVDSPRANSNNMDAPCLSPVTAS